MCPQHAFYEATISYNLGSVVFVICQEQLLIALLGSNEIPIPRWNHQISYLGPGLGYKMCPKIVY